MHGSQNQNIDTSTGTPAQDSMPSQAEGLLPSIAASLSDAFDNSFLIQAINEAGYMHHSTEMDHDIEHQIYYNPETQSAYVFTDSLSVPGRSSSQGAIAIVPVDNMLVPAVMVPAPSATTFVNSLVSDAGEFSSDTWKYYMNYCSSDGQIEVYMHESVHLEQILSGTPWGQAVASHAAHAMIELYANAGFLPAVSSSLKEAMSLGKPDMDTVIAAELTQEILAHVANPDTNPERAKAAVMTTSRLHESFADPFDRATAEPTVRKAVSDWCHFISQFNYPEPTDAAVDIATAMLLNVRHV